MSIFEQSLIKILEQQNELLQAILSAQILTLNTLNKGDPDLTEGDVFSHASKLSRRFD